MKVITFVAFLLALVAPHRAAAQERHDGNWWLGLKESSVNDAMKTAYIAGLFDGAATTSFELLAANCDPKKCDGDSLQRLIELTRAKYFPGMAVQQLKNGIDVFFKDFKNRRVHVSHAAVIALCQIAGEAEEIVEAMSQHARQLAVPK